MTAKEIDHCIEQCLKSSGKDLGRHPLGRYASYDYCFNYFQGYRDAGRTKEIASRANLEASCLQLGFYLASWGMLRASSHLLQRSARYYEPVIRLIANADPRFWTIDADSYAKENIQLLVRFSEQLRGVFDSPVTDTLVTKIMLGVFGNVPAFDRYFCAGMKMHTFSAKNLGRLAVFYTEHKTVIDRHHRQLKTLDFDTGRNSARHFTRAKIIDMIGIIVGGIVV